MQVKNKKQKYFNLAKFIAEEFSEDLSTKVGAIVINPYTYQVLVTGYNGFPRKVIELKERKERPLKYIFTEHAERNAIYFAARHGVALEGATMYSTLFPCHECARGIIQVGIERIITPVQDNERWIESSLHAKTMFEEAGVLIETI